MLDAIKTILVLARKAMLEEPVATLLLLCHQRSRPDRLKRYVVRSQTCSGLTI
jgi:hypothetical protein